MKETIRELQRSLESQENVQSTCTAFAAECIELKAKHAVLKLEMAELQTKLKLEAQQRTRSERENIILAEIIKDLRKNLLENSKELEFRQLEPLLAVYEQKHAAAKQQLDSYQQRLNLAKREYNRILDSFQNN